jgi:CRP/FNR family transcriptional regulator, cyclic AMP receptor protein
MNRYTILLKQADIFYQLTPTQIEMISDLCQEIKYDRDQTIFHQGANSDELYIIVQGEVDILISSALDEESPGEQTGEILITTLRRGQSFGEIALVDQGLRSATARASQNGTTLLAIQRQKLMLLCESYPQLGYYLMRNLAVDLALKIRSTDLKIREELLYGKQS